MLVRDARWWRTQCSRCGNAFQPCACVDRPGGKHWAERSAFVGPLTRAQASEEALNRDA